jgi:hypothetical protein
MSGTKLTPNAIWDDLRAHTPYEQQGLWNKYRDVPVHWRLAFNHAHKPEKEKLHLVTLVHPGEAISQGYVRLYVSIEKFPRLKSLNKGAPVEVTGKIGSVDPLFILLRDGATLSFPED